MTTDTAPKPADEQPTENLGSGGTAVLTEAAPREVESRPTEAPRAEAPYGTPTPPAVATPAPSTPFSLTSLILGVTSVFFGLTVIAPVAGLVFGILGLRREPAGRTLAIWGIVLNAVMLGFVALMIVGLLFLGLLVPFVALATGSDLS
ncbi:hypothetical protein SAMN06295885_2936 [Rathayibacter oskolensis]|uniref:DUF4190 domain-containing protein n=1 Tax=Rathayibacter oskolensis TaxID=1891671 RepID=A0A1X7P8B9_9MICO|nr:DUF4190 domain-containing protein [Rathayibacter oskolensis]SMH47237.1 hypothetical protein SAMN06295885_2936 [Rathayibacter oskolensis]